MRRFKRERQLLIQDRGFRLIYSLAIIKDIAKYLGREDQPRDIRFRIRIDRGVIIGMQDGNKSLFVHACHNTQKVPRSHADRRVSFVRIEFDHVIPGKHGGSTPLRKL